MSPTLLQAFGRNFMGQAPGWYKKLIVLVLIFNPIVLWLVGPFVTGWLLIGEFILTLAMALKCYPLQPGGLIALEAVVIGLTSTDSVFKEIVNNIEVIFLLVFMVAGIYFMKDLLLYVFTKLLIKIRTKLALSLLFSITAAVLSAFLDALTVTAVLISVIVGFYTIYHKVASGKPVYLDSHDHSQDSEIHEYNRQDLENFRSFLRSLIMHAAVGTALGGVCTLVGEPQNLLIAEVANWEFIEFFTRMAHVTMPTLIAGLCMVVVLEKTGWFGYGQALPDRVRAVLEDVNRDHDTKRTNTQRAQLIVQGAVAVVLVFSLAFHVAEVGLIGLLIIVLQTAFNGVVEEHQIGRSFEEGLPFTALIVVFFAIVAMIHDQHLFSPVIHFVLELEPEIQPGMFFIANGLLSMISDNVFVATVYISEIDIAYEAGEITREHFNNLAVAINTGTNLPSVATPNGQAAFLFLLTSALAPLIRLSYGRMVWMALPYTIVLSVVGFLAVSFLEQFHI